MQTPSNWSSKEMLFPGVWVYRDVIKPELKLMERTINLIESSNGGYKWQDALVGYQDVKLDYRDCQDFKVGEIKYPINDIQKELTKIWKDSYDAHLPAVEDYCAKYNVRMNYWEVMNFIKYGPNQHFQEHADHGYSYSATVSLVAYPNDDYEGGELYFPKLDLNIKPKAGDLYIFPSTYLFSHVARPVKSGKKYSIVTMLDYNDNAHSEEFYRLVMKRNEIAKANGIQN
jgi:hypothetical protein